MDLIDGQFRCIRIGFGTDLHVLEPGEGIVLGGVAVPCGYSVRAVSDGDVVLHALVDAMLGCAGLGDIGDHFPESVVESGESSRRFVVETREMLAGAGFSLVNIDCVIDLEVVRLAGMKGMIRASLAGLVGLEVGCVNVKAKTAEGVGVVGEGVAVGAQVVVLALGGGV